MSTAPALDYCAIDFGTSNSAVAIPNGKSCRLVALEETHTTMPTAVFYRAEPRSLGVSSERCYGRAALAAYTEGQEGRLMRSMKSILGSGLIDQTTDVGQGRGVRYADMLSSYLGHLRDRAQAHVGDTPLARVVLGRPVFFVDDAPQRDAQAQASLEAAARRCGFTEVAFQYEPIAAAMDYESTVTQEQWVLVADIGGGTSDFSVVRVGPDRRMKVDRRADILSSHGIHRAGTDFDRHIELATILRQLGYRSEGPRQGQEPPRVVPSTVYFDLATWHLINTLYTPLRKAEVRSLKSFYGDPVFHHRLMVVLEEQWGHALASKAEAAKIEVSSGRDAVIDLDEIETGLKSDLRADQAADALQDDVAHIANAARTAVGMAGLRPEQIDAVYFTGGSTGLQQLVDAIAAPFSQARRNHGDRLASVATGLGLMARRMWGTHASAA